jgi:predicted phosphatase
VTFQKEIDERFGISIDDTATFDYSNLSDLADYVFTLISENSIMDSEPIKKKLEMNISSFIENFRVNLINTKENFLNM